MRKPDANEAAIVTALRKLGATVVRLESPLAGVPDLAVGLYGRPPCSWCGAWTTRSWPWDLRNLRNRRDNLRNRPCPHVGGLDASPLPRSEFHLSVLKGSRAHREPPTECSPAHRDQRERLMGLTDSVRRVTLFG
jgi:hypothetical protein